MPIVPDYAPVTGPRLARGLYGWVLFCAIAPMVTGVGILLLYVITRDRELPIAGFFFLGIGFVLVLIGYGLLIWYHGQQRRANLLEPAALRRRVRRAALLLTANFAVAFGCVVLGINELNREIFVVRNTGTATLQNVRIVLPSGTQLDFGALAPQQSKRRSLVLPGEEGTAQLKATVNGREVQQSLDTYFGNPLSGRMRTVTFDGTAATVN